MVKLNIGCGDNKIDDYVNIDSQESVNPDIVCNIIQESLPYEDNSVDEIVFFHTIEHIEEKYHVPVLLEFWRVLKSESNLFISYPEFKRCAHNYITNHQGKRSFWKNTIYGLQRHRGDYHVSLMDTDIFVDVLQECGFKDIRFKAESVQEIYNTIVLCNKGEARVTYEDMIVDMVFNKRNGK